MKKILVVDDDGATRNLLSNYLGDAGFQCVVAASATEGVQLFEREKPDVVLIDMLMPYVGGAAAIADVRRAARRLGLMVSVAGMTAGEITQLWLRPFATCPNLFHVLRRSEDRDEGAAVRAPAPGRTAP